MMRTIKTYSNRAPFYNAFIRRRAGVFKLFHAKTVAILFVSLWIPTIKTLIEYRIGEELARLIFAPGEVRVISEKPRLVDIRLDAEDSRWIALAQLYDKHRGKGFYGWQIHRKYSSTETRDATLHLFQITTGILPAAEECGTRYDDNDVCPLCGAGRVQLSPLRLRLSNAPKRDEFAQTWFGEAIVSARVARLLIDEGMTGFGLGPVQRSKKVKKNHSL